MGEHTNQLGRHPRQLTGGVEIDGPATAEGRRLVALTEKSKGGDHDRDLGSDAFCRGVRAVLAAGGFTGEEEVDAGQFADIDELAAQCRFGDCQHAREPGCAVRAALESGALDPARWASYQKLRDEVIAQAESLETQLKRKSHDKVMNKALGARLKDKYGHR